MQAHLRALSHTFLAHHYSPMHTTVWPCAHQHNPLDCFFSNCRKTLLKLKATTTHYAPFAPHTHSRSRIPVWICPDKNAPQEGDWASVSAGLFWGISLAHLFDPKHSALSPPEQCSGALGRNQDVILNWLKGKVCLDLFLVLLYLSLTRPVSPLCCSIFYQGLFDLFSCHSKLSLCGQYYREYVLDKDTATLNPTFLYGVLKKNTKSSLYYVLMSMMKWNRNMQKPRIINARLHFVSAFTSPFFFLFSLLLAAD